MKNLQEILGGWLESRGNSSVGISPRCEKIAAFSITDTNSVSDRFKEMYSRMKYGDPEAAWLAATIILNRIMASDSFREVAVSGEQIVITSSAFGEVPTASYAIMKYVALILRNKGFEVVEIKIDRAGDFGTTTYGNMSVEERERRMKSRKITLSDEFSRIIDGRTCFIIDDVNVTGSHERTLKKLLSETNARALVFCYLLDFEDRLAYSEPHMEDFFNHFAVKSVFDLVPFFKIPDTSDRELRINARTIKFILSTEESDGISKAEHVNRLRTFFGKLESPVLLKIYKVATSADGYFCNPKFVDGFHVLSDSVVAKGVLSIKEVQRDSNTTVIHSVSINEGGQLIDMATGENLDHLGRRYSLMKYGSYSDIKWFGQKIADKFIGRLKDSEDNLIETFLKIKEDNGYVVLLSPGSRNVESAQNFIYEIAVKRINVWLAINDLPTIILVKLSRFSSGTANYAQLSAEERMKEKRNNNAAKSIMPGEDFFQVGKVHVLFADDVRITGASADRVELVSLQRGAHSFFSMYCLVIDPKITTKNPAIEHFMNTIMVKGNLDENITHILNQEKFRPVQRMMRLVLGEDNRSYLKEFMSGNICDESIIRIYESALGNNYSSDERYAGSIPIIREILRERNLIDAEGLLL